MTVYVDDMYRFPLGRFGRMKMSHMVADRDDELHEMAAKIGLARKWFQGDHNDICMSKRSQAIAMGARAVSLRTLAAMVAVKKRTGVLASPEDVASRHRSLLPSPDSDLR